MVLKVFNLVFLVAFALSAAVQYNDPDTLIWVAIYLAAAGMCLLQYRHIGRRWLPPALLVIALVWIATLLPSIVGHVSLKEVFASISMQTKAVEEAREIGGLALIALWAGVLMFYQRPG
jgi:hypothetical protein